MVGFTVRAGRAPRLLAAVLAAVAATGLVAGLSIVPASAAPAAKLKSACFWVEGDVDNTFTCGRLAAKLPTLSLSECWKYPPAEGTYIRFKGSSGWTKADVGYRVRELSGCRKPYPWKTVVTIPAERMNAMAPLEVARYRLTMPESKGTYDGKPYSYGKTEITWGVCVVLEGTSEPCATR
ncbi:MAG: hypothetical protein ACKOT0_06095 [bacterium]